MSRCTLHLLVSMAAGVSLAAVLARAADTGETLKLHTRSRTVSKDGDAESQSRVAEKPIEWDPHKTALIICDMWDDHWCRGARGAWWNWRRS